MTQYVQEKVERFERPITSWALLGVIFAFVFAYAYFINATISNIVATKDMQSKLGALTSSVSGLESRYLAAKSSLTKDDAFAMGFTEPKGEPVYVSKVSIGSLSFNR
ncbi:hypothetical protein KW799_00665 [Candidatus Parcubacteria bacterium]|nr:hypothetical protein [Candidatus Parcubacteria bacterium]